MRAAVVVASNRASTGVYEDTTGPLIVEALQRWGFEVGDPAVVGDGPPVTDAIRAALAEGAVVVLTTGGTGINPTDATPEATRLLLTYELPGIAEAIRAHGVAHDVPTAMLSRGVAGVSGKAVIVNLPGSRGGVKDGLTVLADVLPHAVDQLHGGDHLREAVGVPPRPKRGGQGQDGDGVGGGS